MRDSLVRRPGSTRSRRSGSRGLLLISDSSLTTGRVHYLGNNVGSFDDMREIESLVRPVIVSERLERIGVNPAEAMKSMQGIDMVTAKVADGRLTGESGAATFLLAYAMGIILYIALLIYGQQIMGAIVEEKPAGRGSAGLHPEAVPDDAWQGGRRCAVALLQIGSGPGCDAVLRVQDPSLTALPPPRTGRFPLSCPSRVRTVRGGFGLFCL